VIYLIENILEFDSLWWPWFVSDVSGHHIVQKFMGQTEEKNSSCTA
jgi:hypothetical protein